MIEAPDQKTPFNPTDFKGSDVKSAPEQAEKNDKLASTYNDIWKNGDPSSADQVLAEDFEQVWLMISAQHLSRVLMHNTG